jgi:hypothetical protein
MRKGIKRATPKKGMANQKTFFIKTEQDVAKGIILLQQYSSPV